MAHIIREEGRNNDMFLLHVLHKDVPDGMLLQPVSARRDRTKAQCSDFISYYVGEIMYSLH